MSNMDLNKMVDCKTWAENMIKDNPGLTLGEKLVLSQQFKPTEENIKFLGIDQETAKAFLYMMQEMILQDYTELMEEGFEQEPWDQIEMQTRVMALPKFYQALLDVLLAMQEGKIRTTVARVEKKLPFFFQQMWNPNEFSFRLAINELNNIASGKADL